jgi:hypothetical protein
VPRLLEIRRESMGLRGTDFVDKRLTMTKILIGKERNERGEGKRMRNGPL